MSKQTPEEVRADGHPSRLTLEELAFSDGSSTMESQESQRHVEGCSTCRARVQDLRAERDAFLIHHPPQRVLGGTLPAPSPRRWRRWMLWLGPVPVALALLVAVPTLLPSRATRSVKFKGAEGARFSLLRSRHGSDAETVNPSEPFRPGDVLRFLVTAPADGYLMLVNVDDSGAFTRYYPERSTVSAVIAAGEQVLPGAIELDDHTGRERIFCIFSDVALSEERVKDAVERWYAATGSELSGGLEVPGAEVASVELFKEPR